MAIDQSTLRSKAYRYYSEAANSQKMASEGFSKMRTAFLCHSHLDDELVKGLLVVFKEAGVDLYVDWNDHSMPETPNGETARKIQGRIKSSDVFLFLATANSKASRWCPWEIGYADSSKKGVYVIPTSDGHNTYGNEYLQLYPKIDKGVYQTDGRPGYFLTEATKSVGRAISNGNIV